MADVSFSPVEGAIAVVSGSTGAGSILTVWAPTPTVAKREVEALRAGYIRKRRRKPGKSNFVVIALEGGGLTTRTISIKPALKTDLDVSLHYGDDFLVWQSRFIRQMKEKQCGVTILRGEPGTGKTTYLKYLTKKLRRTHRFYYLPLSVFPWLSNPSAIDFWLNESATYARFSKVVILEDAESLLMQRASDNQQSVSTLLNISDGFFGDVLNLHVICTINCPIERIDPAIVRPGRLLSTRVFGRLPAVKAEALASSRGLRLLPEKDYTLGELYNEAPRQPPSQGLGFAVS